MLRLTFNEVATLFNDYEKARETKIPDVIKQGIEREAAGHQSSFMTLMSMFDKGKRLTELSAVKKKRQRLTTP
jgi:hypothetical protein